MKDRNLENYLVGRKFAREGKLWVITWSDKSSIRATPMDCKDGLTSLSFKIDDIGLVNMHKE